VNVQFIHQLHFKLAIAFLLASLLPLGIVSFYAIHTADDLIQSIVTNQLENVAAEKQQLLQRWIAERQADLEVAVNSRAVKSLDPRSIEAQFQLMQIQYKVYPRLVVAGADGKTIYDSYRAGGPAEGSERPWFRQAISGQRYMSPVHLEAEGRESVFQLAAPILGENDRPKAAACLTVSTEAVRHAVLQVSLGATGECYLVDRSGTFLAHQDPARILKSNIASSESFTHIFLDRTANPLYTDYRGISVLGASRAIPGTQWFVVVEQDEEEAFGTAAELQRNIYLILLFTVVVVVAVSFLLAHSLSAPIRRLSEAAQALAQGDFQHGRVLAPSRRRDEVGMLHRAFQEMAARLYDRHTKLETRVGATEAELQEADRRLQSAILAAARAEHLASLGRLASGVAHEIRTPLASLKLYLQSVREDLSISPEFSEDFQLALQQVERMENTVNHFLSFARPQEPVLTRLDFRKLIDDALIVVRQRAMQQHVEIGVTISCALPSVVGDMRQLGESLVNLLVNALDAMPRGGRLKITVQADTTFENGQARDWLRLDVVDNGSGIQQPDLEKLFEPFFTTKASGSGLGLSIVQSTVERHGGTVGVESTPGMGTRFSIFLPVMAEKDVTHVQITAGG
jgi:two-component system NtrC family sensor kinase